MTKVQTQSSSKKFIVVGVIGGLVLFGALVWLVGQGAVRHVSIFYPETVRQTVAFRDDRTKTTLTGISGVGGVNPTLITRMGFAYILTVINDGTTNHRLYIDGLNAQTELLAPGEKGIIIISPQTKGTYNYYDTQEDLELLGQLMVVKVAPNDLFDAKNG